MSASVQSLSMLVASFVALVAAFSAITAYRGYKLARSIQDDARSDERIVLGRITHPGLRAREHAECVLQVPLFNKSKRKACITDLAVFDEKGESIPSAWSDAIDDLGNVQNPGNLVGLTDGRTIYVRRNDGEPFRFARLLFSHSFSHAKEVAVFDEYADFAKGE